MLKNQNILFARLLLTCFIVLILVTPVFAEVKEWNPKNTWVFAVGILEWKDNKTFTSFSAEGRKDVKLIEFFKKSGVPLNQIVYLQDEQATKSRIEKSLKEFLGKAPEDSFFLFYFCGHGFVLDDGSLCMANYDAGDDPITCWSSTSLIDSIDENFGGSSALLLADCCYSGNLSAEVKEETHSLSFAVITSAECQEKSTGNWTFTEGFIEGMNGEPLVDLNGDGKIVLNEIANYIKHDMEILEEQFSTFATTGNFNPEIKMANTVGKLKPPPVGNRMEAFSEGDWYRCKIIDVKGNKVKVKFIGLGYDMDEYDEWIDISKIRAIKTVTYPAGTKVEVQDDEEWLKATVLEVKGSIHFVHYDDYDSSYDEWVPSADIRLPKK